MTMQKKCTFWSARAFSLIEVLGGIALVLTIAAVALISIKDTVISGQRSAVQRELQALNSAWQNFKSAGGVIEANASVVEALAALKRGVEMAGSDFAPLATNPKLNLDVGGNTYTLQYDPEEGFSYIDPSGSGMGRAGEEVEGIPISGYPFDGEDGQNQSFVFDPTDPAAIQAALAALENLNPEDPAYAQYLQGLNAAALLGNVYNSDLIDGGLVFRDGNWIPRSVAAAEDISRLPDPAPLLVGLSNAPDQTSYFLALTPEQQASLLRSLPAQANIADIIGLGYGGGDDTFRDILAAFPSGEAGLLLNKLSSDNYESWMDAINWQIDFTGLDLHGWAPNYAIHLGHGGHGDLSGIPTTALNRTEDSGLWYADLSGRNLTGLITTSRALVYTNMAGSKISLTQIIDSGGIRGANLTEIGITREDLQAALLERGKTGWYWDLDTVSF